MRVWIGLFAAAIAVACSTASAANNSGRWMVDFTEDKGSIYAETINDSGAVLGEWCNISSKQCYWMIATDTACEKDHTYPVLANADAGASEIGIVCRGKVDDTNMYAYVFDKWKDLEGLLKNSKRIGFAVPMQSDQFRVYRFNLDGALEASSKAETVLSKITEEKGRASTTTGSGTATETL